MVAERVYEGNCFHGRDRFTDGNRRPMMGLAALSEGTVAEQRFAENRVPGRKRKATFQQKYAQAVSAI